MNDKVMTGDFQSDPNVVNNSYTWYPNPWSTTVNSWKLSSEYSHIYDIINELAECMVNRNITATAFSAIVVKTVDVSNNEAQAIVQLCECLAENNISKETFMLIISKFIKNSDNNIFDNRIFYDSKTQDSITSISNTTVDIQPLSNQATVSKPNDSITYKSSVSDKDKKDYLQFSADIASYLKGIEFGGSLYSFDPEFDTKIDATDNKCSCKK